MIKKACKLDLFPTELFLFDLDIDLDKVRVGVRTLKEKYPASAGASNVGGWQSNTDTLLSEPGFEELLRAQDVCIREVIKDYLPVKYTLSNSWVNINYGRDYNMVHVHPGSTWSCCFYLENPGGAIAFHDPRETVKMEEWGALFSEARYSPAWRETPAPGSLLVFPSWAYHSVEATNSPERRVTIASNYLVEGSRQ